MANPMITQAIVLEASSLSLINTAISTWISTTHPASIINMSISCWQRFNETGSTASRYYDVYNVIIVYSP